MKVKLQGRIASKALCTAVSAAVLVLNTPVAFAQPASTERAATDASASNLVTLNFVNADIEGVARAMGVILKRQFVVDPRVKGTMTLYSEQPMTRADAYLSFLASLRGLGFALVQVEGLYKIVPEADAKLQTGAVTAGGVTGQRGDQILTQIFRLSHENANNLVTVLRPLISPNNTINVNAGNNSLVITDYADNLRRLAKIIAALDLPSSTDVEVIPLRYAVASDIAPMLLRLTDQAGGVPGMPPGAPQQQGGGGGGSGSIIPDSRTNSLLVRAQNPARLSMIRSLVERLDRPGATGAEGSGIHVVYLKNADAVRLAQVLRAAFAAQAQSQSANQGGGFGGQGGQGGFAGGAGGGAQNAAQNNMANFGGGNNNSGVSAQAAAPIAATAQPSTGGFIQADPASNSLIITASEPLYRQLRAVIDQLDSRRAQVHVETMIVEVSATKIAEVGFQWQGLLGKEGDKYGLIGGTNFGSGGGNIVDLSIAAAGRGSTEGGGTIKPAAGLNVGLIKKFGNVYSLAALARFLETNADGNVLSTPNLVTLDNEEAKITVGQNVPFVTGQFTGAGGTSSVNPFQTIERKDVGITLRVKPQIGENGTVRMQIYQEVSDVVNEVSSGLITNKRSIESNVVVDNGQIVALGGLMEDKLKNNQEKVPLLGDAPLVGGLFRNDNRERRKTNLMIFLRPVVMRDQQSLDSLSMDRYDVIRAQQKDAQPEKRTFMPINDGPVLPALRMPQRPDAATPPQAPAPGAPAPQGAAPPATTPPSPPQQGTPAAPNR
ncbi:type II secretion system secretin GspD [Caldimonas brevitalea]|uniref:General secretion pathway protein GspD n=1 Tax=Caldimonas brevitalea TaxID=413882 RepID=A0A0G3BPX8_9BURK|nr:type II secretion system secretin GspD [Caldimonas brevitalea]AKJ31484.1 general secretion pathway protein GspD [Caldimonas brevitalea]